MDMFTTSVLLHHKDADGTITASHTLHWGPDQNHDEAIARAIDNAKKLKPDFDVIDVGCANTRTGETKQVAVVQENPDEYQTVSSDEKTRSPAKPE